MTLEPRSESLNYYTTESLNDVLNTAAISLLDYANNHEFCTEIFEKAKEECSGDNEVLFNYINTVFPNLKTDFESTVTRNSTNIRHSQNILSEFDNLPMNIRNNDVIKNKIFDGDDLIDEKYYTQIFIPFIENFNIEQCPKGIAVASTDDDRIYGYKFEESGEVYTDVFTEEYAENNLVWVISVNESIISDELLEEYWDCIRGDTINNDTIVRDLSDSLEVRVSPPCKEYYISEIYLKEDLENWWGGKSDVWVIGAFINGNGDEVFKPTHFEMTKVKEKNLNKWIKISEDDGIITVSQSQSQSDPRLLCPNMIIDFIIYEKDRTKEKWQRKFRPWKDYATWGNETYYYYSRQNDFYSRTFPYCGRWYHEVPSNYVFKLDKVFDWQDYTGYSKGKAAYEVW
ncbi:MAG TPA: hypothetical protein ENK75_03660 [Saprospiraceae bacterium]|nr:hypothetical protein [Saprospiraceae bacterium]HHH54635.1 hypothetical protein [Bacteroidota bacterium]